MIHAADPDAPIGLPRVIARVSCKLCRRRGQYRIVRLAQRYGAEIELERLLEILAADCQWLHPGRKARNYEARCGVRFTDLDRAGPPPDMPPRAVPPILMIVKG